MRQSGRVREHTVVTAAFCGGDGIVAVTDKGGQVCVVGERLYRHGEGRLSQFCGCIRLDYHRGKYRDRHGSRHECTLPACPSVVVS